MLIPLYEGIISSAGCSSGLARHEPGPAVATGDGVCVDAHYLEEAEDWSPGYIQCTGDDCPACAAGINRSRFLLLPVVDRVEGKVKLLRVPAQKGPVNS